MSDKLQVAQHRIAYHLDEIMECFMPNSKLTLIVRPMGSELGNMDFVMTDDDLDKAIAVLERRKAKGNEAPEHQQGNSVGKEE